MAAGAALAVTSVPAHAFGTLLLLDSRPASSQLLLGPSVAVFPRYPGASSSRTWLFPGIDYYAANGVFVSTQYGVGWNASSVDNISAGLRLWPQFGREGNPPGLPGLRGVNNRIGVGPFLNYAPYQWLVLQSSVLAGSARNREGMTAEFGITSGVPIGSATLAVSLGTTWANRAYRRDYFGVSRSDAAASGLPVTRQGAGWNDVSAAITADVPLTPAWSVTSQLLIARLLGDSAASPIVRSRDQATFAATLWYRLR